MVDQAPPDPNTDQHTAKEWQAEVLAMAAQVLHHQGPCQPGEGVEMFTQFLFYDEPAPPTTTFNIGICNRYGPERVPPVAVESESAYKRPAFAAWKKFGL